MTTLTERPRYTALIRTFNSAPLVFDTIAALRAQTHPPERIVVVDSGTAEPEHEQLKAAADVFVDIAHLTFNYSYAINVGLSECLGDFVLVISSHIGIQANDLIERALVSVRREQADGFYCCGSSTDDWHEEVIDRARFNGRNGLSNSFGFLPLKDVLARPFREDVFSAEDQEWALWFFTERRGRLLRIESRLVQYLNRRFNYNKLINEELAIAWFVDRRRLGLLHIAYWLLYAMGSYVKGNQERYRYKLEVAQQLWRARRTPPVKASRYF